VDFWHLLISLKATVSGLQRGGFFTPSVDGALFLGAFVDNCFIGALPPVDFLAVCLVLANAYNFEVVLHFTAIYFSTLTSTHISLLVLTE
jgi:hypothetical protein